MIRNVLPPVALLLGACAVVFATRSVAFPTSRLEAPTVLAARAAKMTVRHVPIGPVRGNHFRTEYVRLGSSDAEGLLYEPVATGPKDGIALVFSHPDGNSFNDAVGPQMATRGYPVLMVNYHGAPVSPEVYAPSISAGIKYVRSLPGVRDVVIVGHSGGGHLMTFYADVAEHGPAACQTHHVLYACQGILLAGLAKPDGLVLLDSTLGALHSMASLDPAVNQRNSRRDPLLDMFSARNGYESSKGSARYSEAFARRFYAAQTARNARLVADALERLHVIEQGRSRFSNDEPFIAAGMGVDAAGARLYQPDTEFLSHTREPHLLLQAGGRTAQVIVHSVRPPMGKRYAANLGTLNLMTEDTTVKQFLWNYAIRTRADFAVTSDDIVGVDWRSSINSTPGNAEGVTVPALVMVMTCHYLVVPGEIIFAHLGSKDRTFAAVEGATHEYTPCRPRYIHSVRRTFNFLDAWLSKSGRFQS